MLKKLKNLFSSDKLFYGFLISLILIAGQLPVILHYLHTPAGFYYPLLDRTSFSDYYYLGLIRYGMGPEWLLKIPYVAYEHQASIIQIFYVFLGKLSLVTHVGPAEILAIFRVLGGLLYALSAVLLFKIILPKWGARLAFVFFLLAEPLPALDFFSRSANDLDNWQWHFGEAARRISAMPPHYTFGKGLTVLSLAFLLVYLKNKKIKNIVVASLFVFIGGIIYPPPVFILIFSLLATFILYNFNLRVLPRLTPIKILYLLAAFLPLVMLKLELAKGYPWDMWNKVELGWNTAVMQFEWGYIRMLGILFFLLPFAILFILKKKKDFISFLILVWFTSSFLLFPFANFLHLGKFRFIEGAQIVPLAVLSVWAFEYIKSPGVKLFFLVIFIVNFLIFTALQVRWSTLRLWSYWTNVYFRREELDALSYLARNVKKDAIVATDAFASNYLPAFAKVRTILGFPDFYPIFADFLDEETSIQNILTGKMTDKDAGEYFGKRNIDYVYVDTSKYGKNGLYPQFLTIDFQNNIITVYKVTL